MNFRGSFLTCIFFSFAAGYFGSKETMLIGDFFKLKNMFHGAVYGCGSSYEMVATVKELSKSYGVNIASINLDLIEFKEYVGAQTIVQEIYHTLPTFRIGNVLDMNCNRSHQLLEIVSDLEIFDDIHPWLLMTKNMKDAYYILHGLKLRIDSEVFLAVTNDFDNDPWIVLDLHNPGFEIGGKLNLTFYGLWKTLNEFTVDSTEEIMNLINCEDSLGTSDVTSSLSSYNTDDAFMLACTFLKKDILKVDYETYNDVDNWRVYLIKDKIARRDLQNLVLDATMAVTFKPPKGGFLKYISIAKEVSKDTMHRYSYALYVILKDLYKFRLKIIRTDNWGIVKNGSWTGVIGALVRRQAEISITPTQFKTERIDVVDQTAICWLARPCFIFRHPRDAGLRTGFTKPLAANVWWATLAILVVIAIVLRSSLHHESLAAMPDDLQYSLDVEEDDSWSYTIMVACIGVFCQQGFPHTPNIFSGRSTALLALVFTFLLFQFYSASIVSSLLSEPPRTINTLKDLLHSSLKLLVEDIPYMRDFFESTTDPIAAQLYREKVFKKGKMDNYVTAEYGLPKVHQGGYALHVDTAMAYKWIPESFGERAICDLSEIELFPAKPVILVVRKGSPYRQMITHGVRKLQERGIMQYHRAVWHHPKPKCSLTGVSETASVALPETGFLFLMLAASYVTSFIILAIERWIDKNKIRLTKKFGKCCK